MMMTDNDQRVYTKADIAEIAGCIECSMRLLQKSLPTIERDVFEDMQKYVAWLNDITDGMGEDDYIVCDGFATTMEHGV